MAPPGGGNTRVAQEAPHPLVVPEAVYTWFNAKRTVRSIPPVWVREWLSDCIEVHYRLLYAIAYGYFHNSSSAEDAVQSAVLRALKNIDRLQKPGSVLAWLTTITRNYCLQVFRRRSITNTLENAVNIPAPTATKSLDFDECKLLLTAINALPPKLAEVVRLRFLEEYDMGEIATVLGLRRNTVDVRLHRALGQLALDPTLQRMKGRHS
jgi:RNA polymerase sigma factor (sigma-70 family)